jgi:hypothetical protein
MLPIDRLLALPHSKSPYSSISKEYGLLVLAVIKLISLLVPYCFTRVDRYNICSDFIIQKLAILATLLFILIIPILQPVTINILNVEIDPM